MYNVCLLMLERARVPSVTLPLKLHTPASKRQGILGVVSKGEGTVCDSTSQITHTTLKAAVGIVGVVSKGAVLVLKGNTIMGLGNPHEIMCTELLEVVVQSFR